MGLALNRRRRRHVIGGGGLLSYSHEHLITGGNKRQVL